MTARRLTDWGYTEPPYTAILIVKQLMLPALRAIHIKPFKLFTCGRIVTDDSFSATLLPRSGEDAPIHHSFFQKAYQRQSQGKENTQ